MAKKKHTRTYAAQIVGLPRYVVSAEAASQRTYDIAIIGGGASGLACAIAAAQAAERRHAILKILVVESDKRVGASIMRSGNGRCNFSNAHIEVCRYRNAEFVAQAFDALDALVAHKAPSAHELLSSYEMQSHTSPVLAWFEQLGLVWDESSGSGGLLYPFSRKANSVLDVLMAALDHYRIEVCLRSSVQYFNVREDTGLVELGMIDQTLNTDQRHKRSGQRAGVQDRTRQYSDNSCSITARRVVVASGGLTPHQWFADTYSANDSQSADAMPMHDDAQVSFCNMKPVLGPLRAAASAGVSLRDLDGIRVQANVKIPLHDFSEEGEVLFRDYGISGIVVFNASRCVEPGDSILLDMAPHYSEDDLFALLQKRLPLCSGNATTILTGFMVEQLAQALYTVAHIDKAAVLDKDALLRLVDAIKAFPLVAEGIADERSCQVKRGGVRPQCVDSATMQLKTNSQVYVLGEALDVDGPCGGYNLHWAWTSGLLAGSDLAGSLIQSSTHPVEH